MQSDIIWPAHSPDLNPLDFHFRQLPKKKVFSQKPETIYSLIECVGGSVKSHKRRYDQESCRLCVEESETLACVPMGAIYSTYFREISYVS